MSIKSLPAGILDNSGVKSFCVESTPDPEDDKNGFNCGLKHEGCVMSQGCKAFTGVSAKVNSAEAQP